MSLTKQRLRLADMTVKAEDCYDPADYVLVHKDYLMRMQEALQRIAAQYSDKYCGYPEASADQMARNDLAGIAEEALSGT